MVASALTIVVVIMARVIGASRIGLLITNGGKMLRKRRKTKALIKRGADITLECQNDECFELVTVAADTKNVTCAYCTQLMIDPPNGYGVIKEDRSDWPKGWWRRLEYKAPDGSTYIKGVKQE